MAVHRLLPVRSGTGQRPRGDRRLGSYARFGIPIAFFTTGAHRDYHQLTDEVQYIDFAKMARVTGLVEASALAVANLDHPMVVDQPKPDPNAACKQ